jgi:hypothetical protein
MLLTSQGYWRGKVPTRVANYNLVRRPLYSH